MMRRYGRLAALLIVGVTSLVGGRAGGQSLVTPTSHWGGNLIPDLRDRADYGLHFLGFTRYGKEIQSCPVSQPGCPDRYTFTPYNDMQETLGFNIISYTHMQNGLRTSPDDSSANADPGPLSRRRTLMLGVVDDHAPEFLQNRVIHLANWRDKKLRRVPRELTDTPNETSLGPTHAWPPVAGWSEEYFLRFYMSRRIDGDEQRLPTPFFVGGGWQLSTLNHEVFVHAGSNVYEWRLPDCFHLGGARLRSAGLGAMGRIGLLRPGHYFQDLTGHYTNLQGVGRVNLEWWGYSTQFEYAITSTTGFFVAPRTAADLDIIGELPPGTDTAGVYQAKHALNELFSSIRVRIGDFTFETYNDSPGGKDKGPSFGAHVSYNVYRPDRKFPWVGPWAKRRGQS
jgi:hypothetical protein